MNVFDKKEILLGEFGFPALSLSDVSTLSQNLALNGYDNIKLHTNYTEYTGDEDSDLFFKYHLTIKQNDDSEKFIIALEYIRNCSSLFIKETNMPEDLFDTLLACSGYTFAFSDHDLFGNSMKICDDLFVKHIKVKYYFKVINKKLNFEASNLINYEFTEEVLSRFNPFDGDLDYHIHSPFNNHINFIFGLEVLCYGVGEENFFFIDYVDSYHLIGYEKISLFYNAIANRTKNNLGIFVSKSLLNT